MKRLSAWLTILGLLLFVTSPLYAQCGGTERWFVKVGTDPDAQNINLNTVVDTTIKDLNRLPQLRDRVPHGNNTLRLSEETTVYRVKGYLVLYKFEDDNDYHLVIADETLQYTKGGPGTNGLETGTSFIAEIPAPECVAGKKGDPAVPSQFDAQLREVRKKFEEKFPNGKDADQNLGNSVPVTITGILFYDRQHFQTGRAVNGVELHPILNISFDGGPGTITTPLTEEGSVSQLLANPGFESGISGWSGTVTDIDTYSDVSAHTGNYLAWMGGLGTSHTERLYQNVTIPSSARKATLSFWLHIETEETSPNQEYDKLYVQITNSSGTQPKLLKKFSNLDKSDDYKQWTFDISEFVGKDIQVSLKATEDSGKTTSFLLDDFVLTVQ